MTSIPVIGVPRQLKNLGGIDSLLSIVQMPAGIPVATVAIDGAKNAALLAARILGTGDKSIQSRLERYQLSMADSVSEKSKKLEKMGYKAYLEQKK